MANNDKQIKLIQKQIDNLSEQLRDLAVDNAQPIIDQATSTAHEYADMATDYVKETSEKAKSYAKENPQQAAGMVAGAVALVGLAIYLMGRSDRD